MWICNICIKFEANANKYTWVWKKATDKFRYKLFEKINKELTVINAELACVGFKVETNPEYTPESLENTLPPHQRIQIRLWCSRTQDGRWLFSGDAVLQYGLHERLPS